MKISKWYHVLVVGGASLLASGCGGVDSQAKDVGITGDGDAEAGSRDVSTVDVSVVPDAQSASTDSGGHGDANTGPDQRIISDAAPADATVRDADQPDAKTLACSESPDPSDPCGCPCCWAVNFLNTDPACEGFCAAGNGGQGCCDE